MSYVSPKGLDVVSSDPVFVRRFVRATKQSVAAYRNRIYLACEKYLSSLFRERSLRILISENTEVKDAIRNGFCWSRDRVEFGPLSPESFAAFDLVVPSSVSDLIQARQWPQLLAKSPLPFPSEESVLLCDDKYRFNQMLIDKGFRKHIPAMGKGLAPPYILKKRNGIWGRECWMIHDRNDELRVVDQLNDPAFFRQEIIRGPREFATHILFANGRIVKSLNIMYEFDSEIPIKGQDHWLYTVIHRCTYLRLFASILKSIGFQGLCCVNYKVVRGRPYILEINPRFGGSLAPYLFSFIRHLSFGQTHLGSGQKPVRCLRENNPHIEADGKA
jgi:ATP-grasp domain-containing protein